MTWEERYRRTCSEHGGIPDAEILAKLREQDQEIGRLEQIMILEAVYAASPGRVD